MVTLGGGSGCGVFSSTTGRCLPRVPRVGASGEACLPPPGRPRSRRHQPTRRTPRQTVPRDRQKKTQLIPAIPLQAIPAIQYNGDINRKGMPTESPNRQGAQHVRLAVPQVLRVLTVFRYSGPSAEVEEYAMPICQPCRMPHNAAVCEDTLAGRSGLARSCFCQHKAYNSAESGQSAVAEAVPPGPECDVPEAHTDTTVAGAGEETAHEQGRAAP